MKKMNKKNFNRFLPIVVMLVFLISCAEDEFQLPKSEPLVSISSPSISALPGGTVTIEASITDPVGLSEVQVTYADWSIQEVISLTDVAEYDLSYILSVPAAAEMGGAHKIGISAVNVNGVQLDTLVTVVLDQDDAAPTIVNSTSAGMTFLGEGNDVEIKLEITDNSSIATVKVVGPNVSEEINVGSSAYNYTKGLNINAEGIYNFEVTVTDTWGNTASETVEILAFSPFESMFLADVDTDEQLKNDLMGVPLIMDGFDNVDSLGKVFEVHYYNESANTEIRLLTNDTTFTQTTFGLGDEPGKLAAGNDASVAPIVLSEVGYTKLVVDFRDLTYSVSTYTPEDTPFDMVMFIGTGVRVDGESTCVVNEDGSEKCFHFSSGKALTVDSNSAYRFTGSVELYDFDPDSDANNAFILGSNPSGWAPFWRFDDDNPQIIVPGGGSNFIFDESAYGTYTVTVDTHLNRIIAISNN